MKRKCKSKIISVGCDDKCILHVRSQIRLPADYIRTLLKILIVLSLDDEGIWFVYIANDVT